MSNSKQKAYKTKCVTTIRRDEAMKLRTQGLSYEKIAQVLGIAKPSAWELVQKALKDYQDSIKDTTAEHVHVQIRRYEEIIEAHFPAAKDPANKEAFFAIKAIRECQVEIAKLLGLYAPTKNEVTGKQGGPLAVSATVATASADYSNLSVSELETLMELLNKVQTPVIEAAVETAVAVATADEGENTDDSEESDGDASPVQP